MSDKIQLTIDGQKATAPKGATVLQAARAAGIYIPTLCYHPDLQPYGGCRLCVVEIENMRGLPTACTTPVAEGMKVSTDTPQLQDLRRSIMQLILSEHPNACLTCERRDRCAPNDICLRNVAVNERCVTCPKNKRCEFREVVDYLGITETTLPYHYKNLPVDYAREPLIMRDYNFCILCGRCVQMCADVRGIGAIDFSKRGFDTLVGTAFDKPLQDSGCRFCGACVEVCPTGALTDTAAAFNPEKHWEASAVPCKHACPAGINVPLYVYLIGEGKFQEALAVIREKVPFPGTLGRVCIHPCEEACRRSALNSPISIKFLKRFVADRDYGFWKHHAKKLPSTGKKVAIVGAGPAGLTAGYYLAKAGHTVTVYEQFPKAGGMMRVGIPDYRLPPEVLDKEIDTIKEAGVEVKLNSKIESVDALFSEGYQAVFLAPGAHKGQGLGVEGDNLPGVFDGASFLRDANLGNKVEVGKKVAVIGGGNVAIDSARTALRLGATDVHIIYRRTRAEMPASPEEVEAAIEEKIHLDYLTTHLKVSRKDGKLTLTCSRNALGEPDASGRRRPVPIKGSEFDTEYDVIIGAIGQTPEIPADFKVKTARNSTIQADADTMATSRQGVWAGGDAVTGPASVIEAIAAGRKAASSIDKFMGGSGNIEEKLTKERKIGVCAGMTAADFPVQPRVTMPCLPPEEVVGNFTEVETGLLNDSAIAEGRRCFQCGFRSQITPAPRPPIARLKKTTDVA
ncbi:MAG: FAD-dependent oxidoreductase [Dehalococcoidales bacterium]|jgi:NADPH-dependent glutamate synthase beta subunit-like oxidoreductase/Pyruvate/2-oxoacid:ferredoxin oxidoreductase delta subunit